MEEEYPYDVNQGGLWERRLDFPYKGATRVEGRKNVSLYSDTGQFTSNCFFFFEGLESPKVSERLEMIFGREGPVPDITLLEHEDFVASFLFKYIIQNNECVLEKIMQCLNYLERTSRFLAQKTTPNGAYSLTPKATRGELIPRCSYKFCVSAALCHYNYPEKNKKSKGCYSDHYVHHKVVRDVESLKEYVERTYTSGNVTMIRNNQEIIKCINTIAYVLKHMYDELWSVYLSCGKDSSYEQLHRNFQA